MMLLSCETGLARIWVLGSVVCEAGHEVLLTHQEVAGMMGCAFHSSPQKTDL